MVYNFRPFTLEPSERRLWGANGSRIELTVKAFDLLVLLVDRAGQLVTKDEILDVIWKDVSIAESNVTTTISMIRKALQEDPEHRYVETIPRKGYRFVSAVTFGQTGTGQEPPRATIPNDQRHSGSTGAFRLKMIAGFLTMAAAVAIVVVVGLWFWHNFRLATSEAQLQNAIKLETAGDDKLALATLEEFLRAEPGSSEALLRAAWLCYEADNDDDAARYLARLGQLRTGGTGGAVSQEIRLNAEGLTSTPRGEW